MAGKKFTLNSFLIRIVAALFLVFITYNPSGYSFFDWVSDDFENLWVLKVFVGVVLLIAWAILLRATVRSLGTVGVVLAAMLFGTLFWMTVDVGLIPFDSVNAILYVLLAITGLILGTGVSWSHVRRRITGQLDVDDVQQ